MLNQGLIWLADNLRTSYGESGLLQLARLIIRASHVYDLTVFGQSIGRLETGSSLSLNWPRWYAVSADDRQKDVQSLVSLVSAGCVSQEGAARVAAEFFDLKHDQQSDMSERTEQPQENHK